MNFIYQICGNSIFCFDTDEIHARFIAAEVKDGVAFDGLLVECLSQYVAHGNTHRAFAAYVEQAVGRVGIDMDSFISMLFDIGNPEPHIPPFRFALFFSTDIDAVDRVNDPFALNQVVGIVEILITVAAIIRNLGNEFFVFEYSC